MEDTITFSVNPDEAQKKLFKKHNFQYIQQPTFTTPQIRDIIKNKHLPDVDMLMFNACVDAPQRSDGLFDINYYSYKPNDICNFITSVYHYLPFTIKEIVIRRLNKNTIGDVCYRFTPKNVTYADGYAVFSKPFYCSHRYSYQIRLDISHENVEKFDTYNNVASLRIITPSLELLVENEEYDDLMNRGINWELYTSDM
jgi:hypothetical protein